MWVKKTKKKQPNFVAQIVGGPEVEAMMTHDILARMSLGSLKHPGLAVVYESLLGFAGDEFYTALVKINSKLQNENLMLLVLNFLYILHQWPEMAGKPFSSCVECFPLAVAIGIVRRDGSVVLLPDKDFPLTAETGIIVIAEDDDAYSATTEHKQVYLSRFFL